MDPVTILAALGPVAVEAVKAAINRWVTPDSFKPANVGEWLQMRAADLDQFRAINAAGAEGESFPWVHAVIKLQRPIVVASTLAVWVWSRTAGVPSEAIDNAVSVVSFYLFGERTMLHLKAQKAGK